MGSERVEGGFGDEGFGDGGETMPLRIAATMFATTEGSRVLESETENSTLPSGLT